VQVAQQHQLDLRSAVPLQYFASQTRGKTVITVCDQSHDDLKRPLSRLHWSLRDPAEDGTMAAFEATYQELVKRITPLSK
jgi:protein-tyrosine-phosphatase